jgi:RNA recognition motif-containing protein
VSTPTEAQRALSELNGKNILDRKVSVQLARKPDEPASAAAIAKGTEGEGQAQGQDQGHAQGQGRRRSTGRGRGRGRGRGGRGGRAGRANGTEGEAAAPNGTAETNGTTASNGPTNVPGQVEPLTETTNEALSAPAGEPNTVSTKAPRQPRQPRQPREERQKGPPSDGVPSKTKVMVANLPYDITEEKLLEIFKEYAPTSAKIALRPIPRFMVRKLQARGEARKGRGFAFVTLANEELQQKAIKEVTGVPVGEREIVVKVAVDSPDKQDDETGAEKENGAPAASTAEGSANTEAAVAST